MSRIAAALLALALVVGAGPASAEEDPPELVAAEGLRKPFLAARALHDDGRLVEAAAAFRRLHERLPLVGLLYDRAVCLEKLGRRAAADRLYQRALAAATAPEDRAAIRARLERRGAPELRGVVFVVARPPMTLSLAGGVALGRTPWNGMLDGERTLVFGPDGERRVTITPRELTTFYYVSLEGR